MITNLLSTGLMQVDCQDFINKRDACLLISRTCIKSNLVTDLMQFDEANRFNAP